MSGNGGGSDASAQNTMGRTDESQDQGSFNNGMNQYMSNVNSQLSAGNPFNTTAYKTAQNLQTSGAMHSTNDAATENMRAAALRTGQNANAIPAATAEGAQKGQMTMDQYNAGRDTANENTWLQQQNDLTREQGEGLNALNTNEGIGANQADTTSQQLIQKEENEDNMWAGLGETAMKGVGAGLTAAYT